MMQRLPLGGKKKRELAAHALVLLEFFHPLARDTPPAGSVRIFPVLLLPPSLLPLELLPSGARGWRRVPAPAAVVSVDSYTGRVPSPAAVVSVDSYIGRAPAAAAVSVDA